MHAVLARQLKRAGLSTDALPADLAVWSSLLQSIDRAYAQADDDRYLLERSLALSSDEMSELHGQLAAERDMIRTVICSLAEGVCALNESGEILFINPVARRLLQLNQDEHLDGRRLTALVKARTEDGRSLDQVLSTEGRGEMRLIIAEQENACITCCIGPLGQRREGLVLQSTEGAAFAGAWNFGPLVTASASVLELATLFKKAWGDGAKFEHVVNKNAPREAAVLRMNIDKAVTQLGWQPHWTIDEAVEHTVTWYRSFLRDGADARELCSNDIRTYGLA